jgi:hypothetical protein
MALSAGCNQDFMASLRSSRLAPIQENSKGLTLRGGVDVQVETVLALVLEIGQQPLQVLEPPLGHLLECGGLVGDVGQLLGADGARLVGDADAVPRTGGPGGAEAVGLDRGRGVRHPQEHLDGLEVAVLVHGHDEALEAAVARLHDPGADLGVLHERAALGRKHQIGENENPENSPALGAHLR